MDKRFVVTIARGFGSGGKEIASTLAKELGIHCYENRILTLASEYSGYDRARFVEGDEKIVGNSLVNMFLIVNCLFIRQRSFENLLRQNPV